MTRLRALCLLAFFVTAFGAPVFGQPTPSVGLASGVGLWLLAVFATTFILVVLEVVESFEPKAKQLFTLKVKAKDPAKLKPELERLLVKNQVKHELRATSKEELVYEVR